MESTEPSRPKRLPRRRISKLPRGVTAWARHEMPGADGGRSEEGIDLRWIWVRLSDRGRHLGVQGHGMLARRLAGSTQWWGSLRTLLAPTARRLGLGCLEAGFWVRIKSEPALLRGWETVKPALKRTGRVLGKSAKSAAGKMPLRGIAVSFLLLLLAFWLLGWANEKAPMDGLPYGIGFALGLFAWLVFFWWGIEFHGHRFHIWEDVGVCTLPVVVAAPLICTSLLVLVNAELDNSPATHYKTQVLSILDWPYLERGQRADRAKLLVRSWRAEKPDLALDFDVSGFKELKASTPVTVTTRDGFLGMEYVYGPLEPASAPPTRNQPE